MPNWLKGGIFLTAVTILAFMAMILFLVFLSIMKDIIGTAAVVILGLFLLIFGIGAFMGHNTRGTPSTKLDNLLDRLWKSQ